MSLSIAERMRVPTYADIVSAGEVLTGKASLTPVLESARINEMVGGRLLIKAEALQVTGSYKFRGAYNCISRLGAEALRRGIVAFSTGNFGQAVAAAAKMLGTPATVVIPKDAPAIKADNARAYGAEILFYDRNIKQHRETIAASLVESKGLTLVPPGDDAFVMAGYGTCGWELAQQAAEPLDTMLVPCGGGGLAAGVVTALSDSHSNVEIYTVEPEGFDDTARSLVLGERVGNKSGTGSICDAILTPMPAEIPFKTLKSNIKKGLVVSDSEMERAMRIAFMHLKLVLEPAGAIALAAVLSGQFDARGKVVGLIASGGNVDPAFYAKVIATAG